MLFSSGTLPFETPATAYGNVEPLWVVFEEVGILVLRESVFKHGSNGSQVGIA